MKRSIFLGITTALALVVLLAGFAYAATGWDSHPESGPTLTSQAASGSGQPTRSGTGRGSCDHYTVHQRTTTRDSDCPGWTDDHPTLAGRARGPLARPRPPAHDPPASPATTPATTTTIPQTTTGATGSSPTTIQ